jgi:hypothetical protein
MIDFEYFTIHVAGAGLIIAQRPFGKKYNTPIEYVGVFVFRNVQAANSERNACPPDRHRGKSNYEWIETCRRCPPHVLIGRRSRRVRLAI